MNFLLLLNNPSSDPTPTLPRRHFNVLLLNSLKFMGGGETWMVRMACHLVERGHQALVVARPKTVLLDQARKLGLAATPLWIAGDLNPILLWKLAALIRKHRIDIVIANTSRDIRIAGIVTRLTRQAAVLGLYQVDRPIGDKWNYRLTFNTFADALVVNSDATRRTILASSPWLRTEHLYVVPHGIDPAAYDHGDGPKIRAELGIPATDFVMGFVGRLSGQKGISTLLAAAKIIEKTYAHAHLVIVGTGTLEKKVRRFAESRPSVHILGFRDDVPSIMRACDVLLVPSLWEGFGLVVVEAMASGTPCIASDISSIPEIITHDVNGLLVPPEAPAALAQAVVRVMRDTELRDRLRTEGLRTVVEKLTVERMLATYEDLFATLRP